jgi:hypothetical protein
MSFAQRGKNNKPIETANLFGALLDDEKKKKKKKEPKLKELQSLSPMPDSGEMNWADMAGSDDDMFGESPGQWGVEEKKPEEEDAEEEEEEDDEEAAEDDQEDELPEEPLTLSSSKRLPVVEEKQLSKKELKRLEMEELDAALAELGMQQDHPAAEPEAEPKPPIPTNEPAAGEGKKSRRRGGKKKNTTVEEAENTTPAGTSTLNPELKDSVNDKGALDPDAVAKLIAAKHGQKKKGGESSSQSAAAKEAAARRDRAKKDKKKNKSNYNQQPTR